jgi:hypothetical protein
MPDVIQQSDSTWALHCRSCGYNLKGLIEQRCPECGTAFDPAARRDIRETPQPIGPAGAAFSIILCVLAYWIAIVLAYWTTFEGLLALGPLITIVAFGICVSHCRDLAARLAVRRAESRGDASAWESDRRFRKCAGALLLFTSLSGALLVPAVGFYILMMLSG